MQTEQEQLDFINKECNTNYTSLNDVDWENVSYYQRLSEDFIREFADKVDWYYISKYPNLSEDFIKEFKDKVQWVCITIHQKLSEDFIREFQNKVVWSLISLYQTLSEDFIREFQDKLYWYNISYHQKLSEDFIREFKDKVDWDCISRYQILSEDFIKEFSDKVDWYRISTYQILSEDFIREFQDKVNWDCISHHQKLSEIFIREFKDKVDWIAISIFHKLSEDFIREFKDKVNWECISKCQTLSEDFIQEFKELMIEDNDNDNDKQDIILNETVSVEPLVSKDDKNMEDNISKTLTEQEQLDFINKECNTDYTSLSEVDWSYISADKELSEDFIREFQDKVNWSNISEYQNLSKDFIKEFADKVDWYWISIHQKLSENVIREFADKVDWDCISIYHKLSESFIREFQDKVNWDYISQYQILSEDFIKEFAKKNKFKINTGYNGPFCLDKPKETECLPESNTEFNINIKRPKKIILTEPSSYDGAIILTEPTGPLEEDPLFEEALLSIKYRNRKLYENELLEVLKNPQLPTLITNIQDLELLLQKIDKQINENNFYHIEVKWTGDGITDGESNDDIFDLETGIFTEEDLKEYMLSLHSFYEIKLKKLKSQYLDIFYGDKFRTEITE